MKPSANIRGSNNNAITSVSKQLTNSSHSPNPETFQKYGAGKDKESSSRHLFTSARNTWQKAYPTISMMIKPRSPAEKNIQYRLYTFKLLFTTVVTLNQKLTSSNPAMISSSAVFKKALPPIYPARPAQSSKPELPANVYRTATPVTPIVIQVPPSQYHQQYCGHSLVSPLSQQMAAVSNGTAN
ncbi:putative calcium-binding protein CML18-like [Capsicum annuum]|nr:putative calcium-binding protein CML18-like [Capsicum annuum]KAF3648914.1 putative calcium-binding protein CML18-like [Capsicum annuum]